jgi:dihydrofolate reductase
MRRLILQMQMTLDGFIGGPNGEVDWAFPGFNDEYAAWGAAELWNASVHLMGRVTYDEMAAHWPTSTEPYAAPMNEIPKIVFSRALKRADWPETRIVATDPCTEITRLKRDDGKPLLAHGGAQIARTLIRSGQIDIYRLIVHPVVLGNGRSLFDEIEAPFRLRLTDLRKFGTGVVAKTFVPA